MKKFLVAMAACLATLVLVAPATAQAEAKVFVCKYVTEPDGSEVLQTTIVVSASALEGQGFAGQFPFEFSDAQFQSVAIGFEGEVTADDCPGSGGTTTGGDTTGGTTDGTTTGGTTGGTTTGGTTTDGTTTGGTTGGATTGGTTGGTTTGGTTGGSGSAPAGALPFTGFSVWVPLALAAALIGAGAFLLRRRPGESV